MNRATRPATEIPAAQLLHHVQGHDRPKCVVRPIPMVRAICKEWLHSAEFRPRSRRRKGVLAEGMRVELLVSKAPDSKRGFGPAGERRARSAIG
jgi:hypothetical protein